MSTNVVELEGVDLGEWEELTSAHRGLGDDEVSVAFSKNSKHHSAHIRFGKNILKKMKWVEKDKLSMFFSKHDKYKWAICCTSKGYKLGKDGGKSQTHKMSFVWPHEGVTYIKAKLCRYEIDREKLIIHVPM